MSEPKKKAVPVVVIGPPKNCDEIGLEHPVAVAISLEEQRDWGLR